MGFIMNRRCFIPILALALWAFSSSADHDHVNNDLLLALPPSIQEFLSNETDRINRDADPRLFGTTDQNAQDPYYAPEAKNVFTLEGYWLEADQMNIYRADSEPALEKQFFRVRNGKKEALLLVHPESIGMYGELLSRASGKKRFHAVATASSRSLLVWDPAQPSHPFIAKVSLDKIVDHVLRSIGGRETAVSVGISQIIQHDLDAMPEGAEFIAESLGIIPKGMERGGMILRPLSVLNAHPERTYLPLFSLYGEPKNGSKPLLLKLLEKSPLSPEQYIREFIIRPFVKIWLELVVDHGILMEPHAQNVLMAKDSENHLLKIFALRDYGGFTIDLEFRRKHGLFLPNNLLNFTGDIDEDYKQGRKISNIRASLQNYFVGGFLYNVKQALLKWRAAGLLPERLPSDVGLQTILLQELEKAVQARSNGQVTTFESYYSVEEAVLLLRAYHRRTLPNHQESCPGIFRE